MFSQKLIAGLSHRCILLVIFMIFHLFPYKFIVYFIRKMIERPGFVFTEFFSGRVSLYQLALTLKKNKRSQIALLPDYVCNILVRAFRLAGWKVVLYETDNFLEAEFSKIKEMIWKYDPGVLVGASVFGSSGLLDLLTNDNFVRILKDKDVDVVLDLAQDVRLIGKLPADSANVHAIISFNDKSFFGAMGGGVLSSCRLVSESVKLSFKQVWMLYKWMALKLFSRYIHLLKGNRKSTVSQSFEYSECVSFPYEFISYHVPKMQLILGIIGFKSIAVFNKKKQSLLQTDIYLKTRYSSGAAFLIVKDLSLIEGFIKHRRKKSPYAIDSNREECLYPDHLLIHNKGFMDYI
jgi:hypothetical protein